MDGGELGHFPFFSGQVPFVPVVPWAHGWDPPQVRPRRRSAGEQGPEPIWPAGIPRADYCWLPPSKPRPKQRVASVL